MDCQLSDVYWRVLDFSLQQHIRHITEECCNVPKNCVSIQYFLEQIGQNVNLLCEVNLAIPKVRNN